MSRWHWSKEIGTPSYQLAIACFSTRIYTIAIQLNCSCFVSYQLYNFQSFPLLSIANWGLHHCSSNLQFYKISSWWRYPKLAGLVTNMWPTLNSTSLRVPCSASLLVSITSYSAICYAYSPTNSAARKAGEGLWKITLTFQLPHYDSSNTTYVKSEWATVFSTAIRGPYPQCSTNVSASHLLEKQWTILSRFK